MLDLGFDTPDLFRQKALDPGITLNRGLLNGTSVSSLVVSCSCGVPIPGLLALRSRSAAPFPGRWLPGRDGLSSPPFW